MSRSAAENRNFSWEDDDMVMIGQDDVSDFNEDHVLPEAPESQAAIRQWLQPTSFDAENGEFRKHLNSHLAGTGDWLFGCPAFQEWHDADTRGMLWIKGIPGSGKSVVAGTLIDRLSREAGAPVLYFFFRQIIEANHTPVAVLRDWLAQVLVYSPPLQARLRDNYLQERRDLSSVSMNDLWRDLKAALAHLPKVYCVVDALDEMDQGNDAFLHALAELGSWRPSRVKVAITSRPVASVERPLRLASKDMLHIRLEERLVDVDIATYVEHRLRTSAIPVLHHRVIKQAVPGRANGLFLYAKLAMDAFLEEGADVQEVLRALPADLNVMYTDLLRDHARRSGVPEPLQLLILSWVTHATRPLRLLEIADMIHVTQSDMTGALGGLRATKDLARSACGPLLEILPDETVSVVHHSLTEFLNGSTRRPEELISAAGAPGFYPVLDAGTTHRRLALACITYLQSGRLEIFEPSEPHTRHYPLRREESNVQSAGLTAYNRKQLSEQPFLPYIVKNWHVHARRAEEQGTFSEELGHQIGGLLAGGTFDVLLTLMESRHEGKTSLHVAAMLGLVQLAELLFRDSKADVDATDGDGCAPLQYAAKAGHAGMVRLLLARGAKPDKASQCDGLNALHSAALYNHAEVVQLLLAAGVDPLPQKTREELERERAEDRSTAKPTPLMYAMLHGHEAAAEAFIPYLKDSAAVTRALTWATRGGHPAILEALLKHPLANVNAKVKGQTLLFFAASRPDFKSMVLLLKAGADPRIWSEQNHGQDYEEIKSSDILDDPSSSEMGGEVGFNALHSFCGMAFHNWSSRPRPGTIDPELMQECLALMLKTDIDIDCRDRDEITPLYYASRWAPNLVQLLLQAGADANKMSAIGETPLHGCRSLSTIRMLAEEGKANINTPRAYDGKTPFLTIASRPSLPLIRLYADLGADLTATDHNGQGALHLFLRYHLSRNYADADERAMSYDLETRDDLQTVEGRLEIVEAFLEAGVPPNLRDNKGRTALQLLSHAEDHMSIVERLVTAGLDLNNQDIHGRTLVFEVASRVRDCDAIFSMQKLQDLGAQLDMCDFRGRSLLYSYVHDHSLDAKSAKKLIELGLDATAIDHDGNTLWHEAVMQNDTSKMGELAELGIDADRRNHAGRSALHLICAAWHKIPLHRSLRHFKQIDVKDSMGVRPLHLAAKLSPQDVADLLAAGASPTEPTHEGLTPLHVAARFRQTNVVGMLLEAIEATGGKAGVKAHLNTQYRLQAPPALHLACRSGQPETVALLLAAGADPNASNLHFPAALMCCIEYEAEEALWGGNDRHDRFETKLLGIGIADVQRRFSSEVPTACLEKILGLLEEHGAEMMTPGRGAGVTHLDQAIRKSKGQDYTLDCLLRLRKRLGLGVPKETGHHGGAEAATGSHALLGGEDMVFYVDGWLEDVTAETKPDYETVASAYRVAATRQAFLKSRPKDASGDGWSEKGNKFKLLKELVQNHEWALIKDLLQEPGNLLACGSDGVSNLERLVRWGLDSVVADLVTPRMVQEMEMDDWERLQKARRGEWPPADGGTSGWLAPLVRAACKREQSSMAMLRCLVEGLGCNVNLRYIESLLCDPDRTGNSALHAVAKGEHWWQVAKALPYLLDHGADMELRGRDGRTPLLCAAASSSWGWFAKRAMAALIERGADVNATDEHGRNCLSYVVGDAGGDVELAKLLLSRGSALTPTALRVAILNYDLPTLKTVLGPRLEASLRFPLCEGYVVDEQRRSLPTNDLHFCPLYYTAAHVQSRWIRHQNEETAKKELARAVPLIELFLEHGADPFAKCTRSFGRWEGSDSEGPIEEVTMLHELLENEDFVGPILRMPSLDLEHRDARGRTVLLAACLRSGWPSYGTGRVAPKPGPAGPACSESQQPPGQSSTVRFLLDRGACITARDLEGRNALHHLLRSKGKRGHKSMRLLISGAPELVNQVDDAGNTCLLYAVHRSMVLRFPRYLSKPIWLKGPDLEAVELLLAAGADPCVPDREGNTPLHYLAASLAAGRPEEIYEEQDDRLCALFRQLIALGAPIDARNRDGETPAFAFLRALCSRNFLFRDRDCWGRRLKEAALRREIDVEAAEQLARLQALADAGADLTAVNAAGETLLHVVAGTELEQFRRPWGEVFMVGQFCWLQDRGVDPTAEDAGQRTCLDVAAMMEHLPILKLFERKP